MNGLDWVAANAEHLLAIFGSLVAAASVIVKLTPSKADDLLLVKLLSLFSLVGKKK
jgi:hypothetical protein